MNLKNKEMCHSKSLKMLSTCPQGYVASCEGCQRISFVFENIYLLFSVAELRAFHEQIEKKINVFKMDTYVGNRKTIILQTPFCNTYFCFSQKEYFTLENLISEALQKTQFYQFQINLN